LTRSRSLIVSILAAGALATGCSKAVSAPSQANQPAAPAPAATPPRKTVGVDALMKAPSHFPGIVTVEGVVSATDSRTSRLALIDVSEMEACGTTACATLSLPVAWQGKLPAVGTRVRVTGKIVQQDGGKLFVADSLHVAQPKDTPR